LLFCNGLSCEKISAVAANLVADFFLKLKNKNAFIKKQRKALPLRPQVGVND
jgi:hypothetical protein